MGISVNEEIYHGTFAAVLAATIINNKVGFYAISSADVTKALNKNGGKATIYGCRVSYYYLQPKVPKKLAMQRA